MWRKEQNIFCREVDVVENKNLQDVTVEQLQAEARCIVQMQGLGKLVEADYVCICFVTKHHYTELPWFSFSLFYILLFSVHIINVKAAKSGTVSRHVLIGFLSQAVGLFTINECE